MDKTYIKEYIFIQGVLKENQSACEEGAEDYT
jgi:hypothetical protein